MERTATGELAQIARRLGVNRNGYLGDRINIESVLGECRVAAERNGFHVHQLQMAGQPGLLGFTRPASGPVFEHGSSGSAVARIYVSTGIHGDEPAGPLAVRQLLEENSWPAGVDLLVCPCLNPTGFPLNWRENENGVDLNRDYREPKTEEIRAHVSWLERQPRFDLSLCLHEDWESHGFYVYELNPQRRSSLAPAILQAVAAICPIDPSDLIEGRPAVNGLICPNIDPHSRPDWPEAFYLITQKTPMSYTLEAPSDFPLAVRVACLVTGVNAAVGALLQKR